MIFKNVRQDGFTLIELLATISILSIVGTLLFSVLINGINYSNKSNETVSIQQQGNIIITKLTSWHEKTRKYEIVQEGLYKIGVDDYYSSIVLFPLDDSGAQIQAGKFVISDSKYLYRICYDDNCTNSKKVVDTDKTLQISLTIKNKNNYEQTFDIKTIVSRL
jgi:prepilin-type N-terminal cleavage/methylation domain-containing protein